MDSIETLIAAIRQGKMVVLLDDEDRENEGDLVMAASLVRPEDINFMATHARGLICLTLAPERCEQLQLPLMVQSNAAAHGTNFTCSIEAAQGVSTGISAADRAQTILTAVAPQARPQDLVQPGHVFPLRAKRGGVLNRAGHTEAGSDLARLAGLEPASVIVEIMNADGSMARRADLEAFAARHQLNIGTIADLITYRMIHESTIEFLQAQPLKTRYGEFQVYAYQDLVNPENTHLAFVNGDLASMTAPYVRVHSGHPLRDWVNSVRPNHASWSLTLALEWIGQQGGVVVMLDQAYAPGALYAGLQAELHQPSVDQGSSGMASHAITITPAELSNYPTIGTGSQILRHLQVSQMRLLSTKLKFNALSGFGLEIVEYIEPPSA